MEIMRQCMEWMMSFGWLEMFLLFILGAALTVLVLLLIGWV